MSKDEINVPIALSAFWDKMIRADAYVTDILNNLTPLSCVCVCVRVSVCVCGV